MKVKLNNPCKAINWGTVRISVLHTLVENSNGFYFYFAVLKK